MTLVVHINTPKPLKKGYIIPDSGTGGEWVDGTYSFLWVAWYKASEADNDACGYVVNIPDEWENIVLDTSGADNGFFTADLTVPKNSIGYNRYPHHYSIYYQSGTTINFGSALQKVKQMASNLTATTLSVPGDLGPKLFDSPRHNIALSPVRDTDHEMRVQHVRTFDGSVVPRSWAYVNPLKSFSIYIPMMGVNEASPRAEMKRLLKWIVFGNSVKIVDDDAASLIENYYGILTYSNYLGTSGKFGKDTIELKLAIETCKTR